MLSDFFKRNEGDSIWWAYELEPIEAGKYDINRGVHLFSFDKKTVFNIFADYPRKLTEEQKKVFDHENPFWARFFSGDDINGER